MPRSSGLRRAIKAAGGITALGKLLGISEQAIQKWHKIPFRRILQIEKATGVPREKLAPELYK